MTKTDLGLTSASKASTYQQNREERMPDTTFHTKGQLRKLLYFIWEEKLKAKSDYTRAMNELNELQNESDMLRKKLLAFQALEINQLKERMRPEMKIAV
jgi:hypothetical protein